MAELSTRQCARGFEKFEGRDVQRDGGSSRSKQDSVEDFLSENNSRFRHGIARSNFFVGGRRYLLVERRSLSINASTLAQYFDQSY